MCVWQKATSWRVAVNDVVTELKVLSWPFCITRIFERYRNDSNRHLGPVFWTCVEGIILVMGSANERRRYNITSSLIGWANTQNDSCDDTVNVTFCFWGSVREVDTWWYKAQMIILHTYQRPTENAHHFRHSVQWIHQRATLTVISKLTFLDTSWHWEWHIFQAPAGSVSSYKLHLTHLCLGHSQYVTRKLWCCN